MDKTFVRNYALFFLILVFCTGGLIYILISGERAINETDNQVAHAHAVITKAEQLSTLIEAMLSAQRGFIITSNKDFLTEYEARRDKVSDYIADLSELVAENKSQTSRLDEVRIRFSELSTRLEDRAQKFTHSEITSSKVALENVEAVGKTKDNIMRINTAILEEEYELLNEHIKAVEKQKSKNFVTLLIGAIVAAAMLLLFNGFLLHAQRKRGKIEASLKDTEERFALVIDGTQDGIFDWDVEIDKVFYSRRFFEMLGYDHKAFTGTTQDFKELLHPEDAEIVWEHIGLYLKGDLSEYTQEFRMKSKKKI